MSFHHHKLDGRDLVLPPSWLIAFGAEGLSSVCFSSTTPEMTAASVSPTSPAGVWHGSGEFTGQPEHSLSADTIDIVSDSALDTSAGTGAQTVDVVGLDGSWVEVTETVTLNGTTAVTTTSDFRRVFRIDVATIGTGSSAGNAGNITAHATGDATVKFSHMTPRANRATAAAFTVPNLHSAVLHSISVGLLRTGGAAGSSEVWVDVRSEGGPYITSHIARPTSPGVTTADLVTPMFLSSKDDVVVRVVDISGDSSVVISTLDLVVLNHE